MELNPDLSERLESLQLPADAIELENLGDRNADDLQQLGDSDSQSVTPVRGTSPTPGCLTGNHEDSNLEAPDRGANVKKSFEPILATTRVYNKVQGREVDAMSSVST